MCQACTYVMYVCIYKQSHQQIEDLLLTITICVSLALSFCLRSSLPSKLGIPYEDGSESSFRKVTIH